MTCAIAYALTDGVGTPNTRNGDAVDVKLDDCFKFDARTCPMCMFHGGTDIFSPNASTMVYRQLRRMKIPAELHLFADRGHGFFGTQGRGDLATGYDEWFGRAAEFIRQMNFDGKLGKEEKTMDRFSSDADRAAYEKEDIWPAGRMPNAQPNQCTPYIEWHFPKVLKTKAIQIAFSGGEYHHNSPDDYTVAPVRRYLNAKGMTVVTLKYRTPRPKGLAKHTSAWQDLQRAVRLVRSKAAEKGLDPERIGVMGFSAGGHLAIMGAASSRSRSYWAGSEIDKLPCSVQWAVAVYPAYGLTDGVDRINTAGGNEDDARLVPEFAFDPDTCPVLFVHGDADPWSAMNSVKCWEQLRRMGVQSDLHTLAKRGHGFQQSAAPGTGSYTWMDRIWEFMNAKGFNRREIKKPDPAAVRPAEPRSFSLDKLYSSNAVLQRNVRIPVSGNGKPKSVVTVSFAGHQSSAVIRENGRWNAFLPPMPACREGRELIVQCGGETYSITNVLVGEVFLCSGQSNMQQPLWCGGWGGGFSDRKGVLESRIADWPLFRYLRVPSGGKEKKQAFTWETVNDPKKAIRMSAICYYFATKLLQAEPDVPVGVVNASVGGSNIESWLRGKGGKHFGSMIVPLCPFRFRAAIWYQGESNIRKANEYTGKLHELAKTWRQALGGYNLPFIISEIAPFDYGTKTRLLPFWQAQQRFAREDAYSVCVPINDCGDLGTVHPDRKELPAMRFAALALNRFYGRKDIPCAIPRAVRAELDPKGGATVHFEDVSVLGVNSYPKYTKHRVAGFELCGADGKWHKGNVEISGRKVRVYSPDVPVPEKVRYLGGDEIEGELYSADSNFVPSGFELDVPKPAGAAARMLPTVPPPSLIPMPRKAEWRAGAAMQLKYNLANYKYAPRLRTSTNWDPKMLDGENPHAPNVATAALTEMLGNAAFFEDVRFAPASRMYIFDDAAGHAVGVFWKSSKDLDRGREQGATVSVGLGGLKAAFFDMMANEFAAEVSPDGMTELPLSNFPVYIRVPLSEAGALAKAFKSATVK